ncbi:EAL domain-containing protein [Alteraurantiacibacter aquimixticola]|uniref:EAL domain-containing protein n=2 Tax=Alteraurantiacibacter aquimixticola TaxID=2489173 RepID=A0A4T3F5J4_9SPHN|nr:EAL domain-containing protein [Alteraurantiacibacter aquimixticola]TIX52141.1 EAL domain-containing protein [Alteraurantiacibacter aquimixticola]
MQVIGLAEPGEGDWARLRSLQYRDLYANTSTRIIGHMLAALITLGLFLGDLPILLLGGWMGTLAIAVAHITRVEASLEGVDHRLMTKADYFRHAVAVLALATVWTLPLLGFAPTASPADKYALWTAVAMLVAGSALKTSQAPITSIIFAGVCGAAGIYIFVLEGSYVFALASVLFCGIIISGAISSARTFLTARVAEAGVAEKDEVVSLLLREFEENEADWLWQVDQHRRIKAASPRFAYALGCDAKSVEGKRFVELLCGDEGWKSGNLPPSLHELADRLKRRESFANLVVQVELSTGRRWWELSGTPIANEKGGHGGFRGVGSDVTEQRESSEKIAYLARYDTLTGLPNRLMLTEGLNEALRYAAQWKTRCAFLMIDLDRFKAVNDSLGHHVGDKLLAQVSLRLKQVISDNEQVGRLGGDEFAVVIRDVPNPAYAGKVADNIIASLSAPYTVDHHTLYIGASVGSAIGPRDGLNVETLMRNADLALYRAKDEGGGEHHYFEPSLHADAEERLKLEASLRHAISREELEVHFQPVVNAKAENVVSFEALLRWNSKEHGFVSPGKFIPLAEDTRLIVPIGDWVLREACRHAATWPEDIRVAVNVSGEQLLEPNFAQTVVRALADTGLAAHRLEVEVTESVFLRDGRHARQTLEEIMDLGCSIALDDFGTGYSSLGYLRTLRFSTIKVDRSFVQGAAQDNRESLAIINAVVAMAQSLEMSTTAEGVEDEKQAQMVRDLGCTKIQGYYFGRPMPAIEARSLVVKRRNAAA